MTNWKTIAISIKRLKAIDAKEEKGELEGLTKRERLNIAREREKLNRSLGGIKDMAGRPDLLFVIDVPKEELALSEAKRLGIPVIAICDTNANPDNIDYPIPGNDDALRAINLYCDLISGSILDGIQEEMKAAGVDLGEAEVLVEEKIEEKTEEADKEEPAEKKVKVEKKVTKKAKVAEEAPKEDPADIKLLKEMVAIMKESNPEAAKKAEKKLAAE